MAVLVTFGKSFINIKSIKGPKTNPCGMPAVKDNIFQEYPSIKTYCLDVAIYLQNRKQIMRQNRNHMPQVSTIRLHSSQCRRP